ncbi:MAG: hypothetical protein HN580_14985 [Deltaproteobacteria bacterium]|nr:hypothetical protein [Deltaproteobacteria bacterium]MBT4091094.1 hypothetical protein [Deltaproteobacteria bacterium]MBT4269409.1 hypothetical protein [Deltaproteobacteria bacterium]MBT4644822.1 hypothetical protein [Deltaproteobacteria bacterium]MBT6498288.1 hypothetical protein [Deltaproteobacteria bacterium]
MKCPKCQTDVPDRGKFCNDCVNKLERLCSDCQTKNPTGSIYILAAEPKKLFLIRNSGNFLLWHPNGP